MRNKHLVITMIMALLAFYCDARSEITMSGTSGTTLISSEQPPGTIDESLKKEVNAAIDRGLDWLAGKQKANGSWSNEDYPALTAFCMQAFIHGEHPRKKEIIGKAKTFILSKVQKDGGIYVSVKGRQGGGLSNYNTAICMNALHDLQDRSLTRVILNARKFIADAQHFGDDVYKGGFGYDKQTDRVYTDGLNTFYTAEGMAKTRGLEDLRPKGEKKVDIDWTQTVKYMSRLQNKKDAGKDQDGGFFYKPGQSKAGTTTNAAGTVVLRSYGSMTYVGLLTLIYADVSREDVRVRSAFDWSAKHWSLKENPGMGAQGLYFFYNVLTKSLDAYGADLIPRKEAKDINWRSELASKLISLQKTDANTGQGYWLNDTGRFWENDPVLSTAYSLLVLETF